MSPDAFEHGLATLTDTEPDPFDPRNYRNIRCEAFGGTQLYPARRGRRSDQRPYPSGHVDHTRDVGVSEGRFFTGALRQLLNVIDPACAWTGCNVPVHYCQGDHTIPETQPVERTGYQTWRDPNGQWHIQRPDGTEIQPAT